MQCDASTERLVPTGALLRYAGLFALILMAFLAAACGAEGPCASKTCFFGECDRETGECVNKPECRSDQDCTAGFSCGQTQECVPENTCESSDDCPGGVCEQGACVNPDTCEVNSDCVPGTYCGAEGTCVPDPCNSVTCERGVCSFEQGRCVNADDCQGDSANCLEGYFCDSSDRCQKNLCVTNDIDCGRYAECNPATGECDNAARCETSVDCLDDRVCGGKTCLEPVSCRADDLEPNDSPDEATDLFDWAPNGTIQASLCEQDADIYDVTTTDVVPSDFSGQMVATVTVPKRDIGLGEATLTMIGPDGNQIGTTGLGDMGQDDSMTITADLSIQDHGTYSLEVSPANEITQNGLEYWLDIRIEKPGATSACNEPRMISPGQRLAGDTGNASGTGMGSSCTSRDNPSPEVAYALETSRPQKVTIEATPTTNQGDATLSLRERCREIATERRCSDESGPGQIESLTAELGEGIYYLVVQAPAGSSLGRYELQVERDYYTKCGLGSNYCVDRSTAAICGPNGGVFNQMSCDKGCNPTFGECF